MNFSIVPSSRAFAIGVCKDNESLLKAVNASIAKALEDGTMEKFIAEENEQASGEKYEGLLDAEGNIQQIGRASCRERVSVRV